MSLGDIVKDKAKVKQLAEASFKALDTNKSGGVEFDEFRVFIIYDPYKWLDKILKLEVDS